MQAPTDETQGTGGVMTLATETRETAAAARLVRGTGAGMREIGRGAGIAAPSTTHATELANREAREGKLNCSEIHEQIDIATPSRTSSVTSKHSGFILPMFTSSSRKQARPRSHGPHG